MNARPALDAASIGMSGCILGFVVAKSADDATPCWGLAGPADGKVLSKEIARLRRSGLELWVSFGGADHRDLASVARDPEALMNLYAGVVRAYGVKGVDFDIEGDALRDREAMLRRAQAWRLWRARGDMPPSILTVPVLPSGLTAEVLDLLLIHRDLGVLPDRLNLMVMNYGPANAPNPSGRMAAFAASAASNTVAQLRANSLSALVSGPSGFSKLGLTPMVGFNSCPQEQFRLQDARRLREWAEGAQPGFLSFWSLNRDRFCVVHRGACRHCGSGVPQEDLDFLRTLAALPTVLGRLQTLACLP
jgi:chitinase